MFISVFGWNGRLGWAGLGDVTGNICSVSVGAGAGLVLAGKASEQLSVVRER